MSDLMNYQYRKRPLVIEAFQMTEDRRQNNVDWPAWLHEAWNKDHEVTGAFYPLASALLIHTLDGQHFVGVNDWIIQGVKGELYPCRADIFAITYEPVLELVWPEGVTL